MYKTVALLSLASLPLLSLALPVEDTAPADLEKRQSGAAGVSLACDFKGQKYDHIVSGPHREFWHYVQVTQNTHCAKADGCNEQYETSHTFGIEVDAGISIEPEKLMGGLDASVGYINEWTTGEAAQCQAKTGQTVCVWAVSQYRNFDVTISTPACSGNVPVHQVSIPVGKASAQGNGFVCKTDKDCKYKDAVSDTGSGPDDN